MQYVERAASLQRRLQFNHGSMNELYPPIMAIWQSVKYFPVEHKDAMNLCRIHRGRRAMQRCRRRGGRGETTSGRNDIAWAADASGGKNRRNGVE